jgi:deoxycytidylate deaminase|tara:strand:+ start:2115 stop:2279 length:165 start_codon:yes stop_codon:yes gene_type:complete
MQQKFINKALEISEKSMAKDHKHGAVCVVGGKIISTGFNYHADPHQIKVREKSC